MDDTKRFYALAMDPIHIGTGGYRLGRVDNTIVRESGTNLPKIPASSISGVCRNYAIYGLDDEEKEAAVACTKREKAKNNCGKSGYVRPSDLPQVSRKQARWERLNFLTQRSLHFRFPQCLARYGSPLPQF